MPPRLPCPACTRRIGARDDERVQHASQLCRAQLARALQVGRGARHVGGHNGELVQAGLCAALLTYFGDAASPATDPREGWTADQRSTLQVLSLSLLQALALV